jgi:hypothetical protein
MGSHSRYLKPRFLPTNDKISSVKLQEKQKATRDYQKMALLKIGLKERIGIKTTITSLLS